MGFWELFVVGVALIFFRVSVREENAGRVGHTLEGRRTRRTLVEPPRLKSGES